MDINRKIKMSELKKNESSVRVSYWRIAGYAITAVTALVFYFLIRGGVVFDLAPGKEELLRRALMGVALICIIFLGTRLMERGFVRRTKVVYTRYNRIRMVRLLAWILVIVVLISFSFKNWYSAAVSLGLISLILGFALQNPIASFIGWVYILIRQSYHVGDRIQIADFRGDVVEVNYLDTTLWEFTSDYMPTGRLIRFPNSLVLNSAVYNYSWKKFPFIWSSLSFQLAYESDLKFVEERIKKIATEELDDMSKNIEFFKRLVEQTPVDELDISKYPYISLRTNQNTWIEVTVTYLVNPNYGASTRTRILKRILADLNENPDRVMFPKSNMR